MRLSESFLSLTRHKEEAAIPHTMLPACEEVMARVQGFLSTSLSDAEAISDAAAMNDEAPNAEPIRYGTI